MGLDEVREWGRARGEFWAGGAPRGACPECHEDGVILHPRDEGLAPCCADCYRKEAVRDRVQACDRCGGAPAFRNPAHRRNDMLCVNCHADDGYVLGDSAMMSKLVARAAGSIHPRGGKVDVCVAKGGVTECKGQTKPRAGGVVMCDRHHDPDKWNRNRQV